MSHPVHIFHFLRPALSLSCYFCTKKKKKNKNNCQSMKIIGNVVGFQIPLLFYFHGEGVCWYSETGISKRLRLFAAGQELGQSIRLNCNSIHRCTMHKQSSLICETRRRRRIASSKQEQHLYTVHTLLGLEGRRRRSIKRRRRLSGEISAGRNRY